MSDNHAAFKQIQEHAEDLALDITAAESAGANAEYIKRARGHLRAALWCLGKGMGKGQQDRENARIQKR